MQSVTHVVLAMTMSTLLVLDLPFVVFGAVIPDIDLVMPLAHRTFFHSLLFGAAISLLAHWKFGKRASVSLFLGFFSHIALDAMTPMGVTLLYPYMRNFSFDLVSAGDPVFNVGIVLVCGVLLANSRTIIEALNQVRPETIRKSTFALIAVFTAALLLTPQRLIVCEAGYTPIRELMAGSSGYDGLQVMTNGTVCSQVELYTSNAGNLYQIFHLCDGENLTVWKLYDIQETYFSQADSVELCGTFTLEYSEPELNYILYLRKL